nr:pyridoxamine 5'-phosphate oxidase family protein [bacterium]
MQEVYAFLKKCGTYFLSTLEGDQPRVRPFGTICLFEGRLYILTGKRKPVSRQIAANPRVELCALEGRKWLRVAATLVEDDRLQAQQAMLEDYPELQHVYRPGDGNTQVFYLKDATATFSTYTQPPHIIRF